MMLLQDHLSPEQRIAAMEKQLTDLRADLANIEECRISRDSTHAGEFVMGYGEAVLLAGARYLEGKLAEARSAQTQAAE
jgi:hypothetical protein